MKQVHFGFSNDLNPTGSFEGIGLGMTEGSKNVGPVNGEFLEFMNINNEDYLVSKAALVFGNDARFKDKYIVRRAIADLYSDGSGLVFLDQYFSPECQRLEEMLNVQRYKELLERGRLPHEICGGYKSSAAFDCLVKKDLEDVAFLATAIPHETFERKKTGLMMASNYSFSELGSKLFEMDKQYQR
jgi:hypothetical protein